VKKVTIGGEAFVLPAEVTLGVIKRFNAARKELAASVDDVVEMTLIAVRIVAAALVETNPELSPEEIEKKLKPSEFAGMRTAMWEVLIASGLYTRTEAKAGDPKPGEGDPPVAAEK
jgi:hypothetical protein